MPNRCKRVCVIGGGLGGIGSIKSLLEEDIEPVCFERTSRMGGTWNYTDEPVQGHASVMSTTSINHSKEMGCLSDVLFPAEAPNYLRHWEIFEHFKKLGDALDLFKYITCNREVIMVTKANDYEESGKWLVTIKNTENGEITSEVFDGVLVCTGHIAHSKMPDYPGMEEFRGKIMHSHDLKTFGMFTNNKVAVVGTGCSALDAATAISNVARQVYLSIRTPSWIISRVGPYGLPIDWFLLRRWLVFFQSILPLHWVSRLVEMNVLDVKFCHRLYGIKPKYPVLCKEPTVNDDIAPRLLTGSIVLRRGVKAFKQNGIIFEDDGDEITDLDAVILATGYTWSFPFLDKGIIETDGDKINLYKCMYPAHLKHPTLAIIGFLLPLGPGFPLGEMQCRWAAHLLSGKGSLPSTEIMMADAERRYQENVRRYAPSEKMSIRVDYIQYMDDVATQFGVKPSFWKMLFADPKLFKACVFGPCLPYQYRLVGPHKWKGARDAILTAPKRMKAPFRRIYERDNRDNTMKSLAAYAISFCIVAHMIALKYFALKYLFLALIIPYYFSIRTVTFKYLLAIFLLPFYIPWDGFSFDYFVAIYAPLAIAVSVNQL